MRADRFKQLLKNGVYRSLGEAATGVGATLEKPYVAIQTCG